MLDDETYVGIDDHATATTLGDPGIVTHDETTETTEAGTRYGEEICSITVVGTVADSKTVEMTEVGTETTTDDGT
jgi:hypothetical protein